MSSYLHHFNTRQFAKVNPFSMFRLCSWGLFSALLLLSSVGWGQKTWDGEGTNDNWGNALNWNPNGTPGPGDTATIPNGAYVNVNNNNAVCASLTILGGGNVTTINIAGSNSLTVAGAITINAGTASGAHRIIAANAGTLSCSSIFIANTGEGTRVSEVTISTGTVTVSGNITMNGNANRNAIRFSGAGTLNIGGAFNGNNGGGLFSTTGSTVNYNGTAPQTIAINPFYTYTNLSINNTAGATLQDTISAARVTETISVGNITPGSIFNTGNLAVSRGGSDAIVVAAGSTLNAGTTSIRWVGATGIITINGTFQTANTAGFSGAAGTAISSTNSPMITLGSSSTIEYNATGPQPVTERSYNNLALSGSGNKSIFGASTTVIANNLSISGTARARLTNNSVSSALSLTLGGVNQVTGSWGSYNSLATNKDSTWFAPNPTGIININTGCTIGTWVGAFSEDWNDVGNWCGGIPTAATAAVIPNGFDVTVNTAAVCASLTINGGDTTNTVTINSPNSLSVTGAITMNAGTGSGDNKVIAVNDGTLSCSAITMQNTSAGDIDSEITITTGTLTVSGDITMNGNANRNSVRIEHAGTLNIGGAITGGEIGRAIGSTVNFNGTVPQIIPTGSAYDYDNVTINNPAGVSFQTAIPVTNGIIAGKIIVGNLVSGSVLNTNDVAVTRGASDTIIVNSGSTLNAGISTITWNGAGGAAIINGTFATANLNGFSGILGLSAINTANAPAILLGANSTIEYNAPSPLVQIVSQRTDYANVTLSGGLKEIAAGTHTMSRNFTINSGVIYNGVPNNPVLNIAGNLLNSGSFFNQGTGRINLNGSTLQTIGGGTTTAYDTLVLNNNAGAQLSSPVYIGRQFIFTQGLLTTTDANVLIFNNTAKASVNDTSFVNGPVQKIGNEAFTFPTGKGTTYGPVSISALTATATFQAEYFPGAPPDLTLGMGIAEIADKEYWDLEKISPAPASASVSLRWFGNAMADSSDLSHLRVAHFTGGAWVSAGGSTSDTDPQAGGMIMSDPISSFSPFILGSSVALNPLPIELISFTATPKGKTVQLDWRTASELNNAFFQIERSANGRDFENIGKIAGAGDSHLPLDYQYTDGLPLTGWNYYRLRQEDFDGQFSYSAVEAVWMGKAGDTDRLYLFPNPANNALNIKTTDLIQPGDWLEIYDFTGQLVQRFSAFDALNAPVDISKLPAGAYTVRLRTEAGISSTSLIMKQ